MLVLNVHTCGNKHIDIDGSSKGGGKAVGETGDGAYFGHLPGGRWEIGKN